MAALDFPASPVTGQVFSSGTITWQYDGARWTILPGGIGGVPAGGSTGQALTKVDGANYNTKWEVPVGTMVAYTEATSGGTVASSTLTVALQTPVVGTMPAGHYLIHSQIGMGMTVGAANTEIFMYLYKASPSTRLNEARFFNPTVNLKAMPSMTCSCRYYHSGGDLPQFQTVLYLGGFSGSWYATATAPAILYAQRVS